MGGNAGKCRGVRIREKNKKIFAFRRLISRVLLPQGLHSRWAKGHGSNRKKTGVFSSWSEPPAFPAALVSPFHPCARLSAGAKRQKSSFFFTTKQTKKKEKPSKKKKTASEPSGAQSASFVSSDRAERRGAFCLPRPPLKLMIPLSKRRGIKPVYYLTMLEQQRKGKKNFFFFLTRPSPFSPLSQQEQKTSLSIDRFALPF